MVCECLWNIKLNLVLLGYGSNSEFASCYTLEPPNVWVNNWAATAADVKCMVSSCAILSKSWFGGAYGSLLHFPINLVMVWQVARSIFFWIAPADVLYSLQMFTVYIVNQHQHSLVGGLEHVLFSIIYWDNPSHWRTHIFQDGYCTTNQI
jgi:hypothetical protein